MEHIKRMDLKKLIESGEMIFVNVYNVKDTTIPKKRDVPVRVKLNSYDFKSKHLNLSPKVFNYIHGCSYIYEGLYFLHLTPQKFYIFKKATKESNAPIQSDRQNES